MTFASEQVLNSKDIADLCKRNLCIRKFSFSVIQVAAVLQLHVTGGVNIYLYLHVSILAPVYPVCVISSLRPSKNTVMC